MLKASRNSFSTNKAKLIFELVEADEVQPLAFQVARDFSIKSIARQMKFAKTELTEIENQITEFLVHFDYNLRQMKGITELTEAMFIAYIGDISRFKNASALAKYAGIAPVTHASGNNSVDYANKQGNRNLNQLFYRLAIVQALPRGKDYFLVNPTFHEYYRKKMAEGKTQRQAIKCIQRRLVNMIYAMMKHKRPYVDPPLGHLSDYEVVDPETGEVIEV